MNEHKTCNTHTVTWGSLFWLFKVLNNHRVVVICHIHYRHHNPILRNIFREERSVFCYCNGFVLLSALFRVRTQRVRQRMMRLRRQKIIVRYHLSFNSHDKRTFLFARVVVFIWHLSRIFHNKTYFWHPLLILNQLITMM